MLRRIAWMVGVVVACGVWPAGQSVRASQVAARVRVAITIDDLPGVIPPDSPATHVDILRALASTLKAHGVRHATGFLNGEGFERDPAQRSAMDAWVEARFEVANHTYTHLALSEVGIAAYVQDIDTNQAIVETLAARVGQRAHYFRCPYLDEGAREADRSSLRRHLRARRLNMARVSIDFDDWAFSLPFVRCEQRADPDARALLQRAYVEHAVAHLQWADSASRQLLGRTMPHVLLLHANPVTAATLDALLSAFDARGVEYISLAQALRDPVYQGNYTTSGTHVLVQAAHQRGVPRAPVPNLPLPLLELACR